MSFPTFKDFDKTSADLLGDDFDYKFTLKVKSAGPANTTLTTNTQYCEKENKFFPKLSLKWAHPSGFTLEKFESTHDAKFSVETSLTGAAPGLKLEFKGNDAEKADLLFTYNHASATVTGEFDISSLSSAKLSVLGGSGPVTAGASADVKIAKSSVESTNFNVGVGYTAPKQFFVGVRAEKNFANYSALFSYNVNNELTLVGKAGHCAKECGATLGAVYKCNPDTTIKTKVTTCGVLSASLKQNFDKKFTVTGSAEIPSNFNTIKVGVNATLG